MNLCEERNKKVNLLNYQKYLINWIRQEVLKASAKGVVIGMSGGVDSSVVATLAKKAFPQNSLGVFLPIDSHSSDLEDAEKVAEQISIKTKLVNLSSIYQNLTTILGENKNLALANIKPRLRMTVLYFLAQKHNYLVLGTDNAAEWILGYFTKYGDGGVDLLPLVKLTKQNVYLMAKQMDLPSIICTKKPSAGLWEGQTDEKELGFDYIFVDKYLQGEKIPLEIKQKIMRQVKITQHKRKAVPTPKELSALVQ